MTRWLCLCAIVLAGCSPALIISDPSEEAGSPNTGSVPALLTFLDGSRHLVVVFIHGVGDHCTGYALDNSFGWLRDTIVPAIGLKAMGDMTEPVNIPDSDFMPNKRPDPASVTSYATRDFSYGQASVHAIEITWSQLTQWVKTQQLGYDLIEPLTTVPSRSSSCPFVSSSSYKKPQPRVAINKILKERVLDRGLADAVLYTGDYGVVMQRGVAEALCLAFGGSKNPDGKMCNWPAPPQEDERRNTVYLFVTHSLGSRILYDTLLGLTGHQVNPLIPVFTEMDGAGPDAKAYVSQMVAGTAAVYMMANQLPMLGLAYDEGTALSTEDSIGYVMGRKPRAYSVRGDAPSVDSPRSAAKPSIVQSFASLRTKSRADMNLHGPPSPLEIIAFSDPNDLLSWGLPKWYQREATQGDSGVHFTNVYVRNSTHWFGAYEDASSAHVNYFTNPDVWKVILCGATNGNVRLCN
jgi:hypothetical protein